MASWNVSHLGMLTSDFLASSSEAVLAVMNETQRPVFRIL